MVKRAQAAMEFLMTYGWAIFMAMAVFAALFFFGIIDLRSKMPETIMFPPPLKGQEYAMDADGTIRLRFVNQLDEAIVIDDTWYKGTEQCLTISNFVVSDTTVDSQEEFVLEYTCPDAKGERVKVYLSFKYSRASTGVEKTHSGYVVVNGQ